MLLYHYSPSIRNPLLTKAASGVMTNEEIQKARARAKNNAWPTRPYCDHISFFFEPIPAALLPTLYPKDHASWAKGTKLYEHIVDTKTFPNIIDYDIVESTKFLQAFDEFSEVNNWVDDNPELLKKWMLLEDKLLISWGERGNSRATLDLKIKENQGIITAKYIAGSKREDFEYNKYKYAATVPHLMLWPPEGKVQVMAVNSLVMGSEKRQAEVLPNRQPAWIR